MRILLTGASGFIGKKVGLRLALKEHQIVVLARHAQRTSEELPFPCETYSWDPVNEERNHILKDLIKDCDVVIHLAGESIASGRWTKDKKKKLIQSRTKTTRSLHDLIERLPGRKPKVIVFASAVGFYGDAGDAELTEESSAGNGFLADLCKAWEREMFSHRHADTRIVALRFGTVLGREGGIFEKLVPMAKLGLASVMGSGKQWLSWIHHKDLLALIDFVIENPIEGVLNACAPNPATNEEFTRALTSRLGTWRLPRAPAKILRLVLGEMAAMLLYSQRAIPKRATDAGFDFSYKNIDGALHSLTHDVENARGTFTHEFVSQQFVPKPVSQVWPFFSDVNNLLQITPPHFNFHVVEQSTAKLEEGTFLEYKLKVKGVNIHWRSKIVDWKPIERFSDMQLKGPFSLWHHTHSFEILQHGTLVTDRVLYRLPFGFISHYLAGRTAAKDLQEIFRYRRERIRKIFG